MPPKVSESYHHGDLRNTLIEAGSILLEKVGAENLSLRDLARESGVSHTAPYRHFANKEELLQALARLGFDELAKGMTSSALQSTDPLKQLHDAGVEYIRLAIAHPERTRLMFGGILDPTCYPEDFVNIAKSAFGGLVSILEGGQKAGLFLPGDSQLLAITAWSLVHGFAMLYTGKQLKTEGPNDPQMIAIRETVLANLVNGLRIR